MANNPTPSARLLRSGMVTALATLASRILGMFRDIAMASLLGAGLASDIFFFANRIPNFFRRLFAEGAFAQAFVPVMTEYRTHRAADELRGLLGRTLGALSLIVGAVCALGMLCAPVITALFGYGWFDAWLHDAPDGFKFWQASHLLQITFPYLFLITITALFCSVLNVFASFAVPAITPCLLNLSLISAALFVAPGQDNPNEILAWTMVAGGLIQLGFILPFVLRLKVLGRPRLDFAHEGVRRIFRLMLPGLVSVSASQLNLLVNTVLATFLATGSISYLYYSDRLLEFPIGIFAVAISTVILPALSAIDYQHARAQYQATLDWGVRLVLLLGLPSMAGIIALREPILRVLFMRGEFTLSHVQLSAASLLASVSGLCAIMLVRVLVQGFAAIQDTRTPVRCAVTSMGANIVFNLVLVMPLGYVGLALSTALAAFVNASLLLYLLWRRSIYAITRPTLMFILRTAAAAGLMGAGVGYLSPALEIWADYSTLDAVLWLCAFIALGAAGYAAMLLLLGFRFSMIRR